MLGTVSSPPAVHGAPGLVASRTPSSPTCVLTVGRMSSRTGRVLGVMMLPPAVRPRYQTHALAAGRSSSPSGLVTLSNTTGDCVCLFHGKMEEKDARGRLDLSWTSNIYLCFICIYETSPSIHALYFLFESFLS